MLTSLTCFGLRTSSAFLIVFPDTASFFATCCIDKPNSRLFFNSFVAREMANWSSLLIFN